LRPSLPAPSTGGGGNFVLEKFRADKFRGGKISRVLLKTARKNFAGFFSETARKNFAGFFSVKKSIKNY
jgi:hypothetical protein